VTATAHRIDQNGKKDTQAYIYRLRVFFIFIKDWHCAIIYFARTNYNQLAGENSPAAIWQLRAVFDVMELAQNRKQVKNGDNVGNTGGENTPTSVVFSPLIFLIKLILTLAIALNMPYTFLLLRFKFIVSLFGISLYLLYLFCCFID